MRRNEGRRDEGRRDREGTKRIVERELGIFLSQTKFDEEDNWCMKIRKLNIGEEQIERRMKERRMKKGKKKGKKERKKERKKEKKESVIISGLRVEFC